MFENTPLARRQWTGLDDEHLASIGFVNFAWNALERKFASLVWVAAGWSQEVGELVVAGMGNVSLVTLFINLLKQELSEKDDRRIWEQGALTGVLFDAIRDARNDMIHTFFFCDPTTGMEGHFKASARKSRSGRAELRTVAMAKSDIDDLCCAISDCFEFDRRSDFENLVPAPHSARKPPGAGAFLRTGRPRLAGPALRRRPAQSLSEEAFSARRSASSRSTRAPAGAGRTFERHARRRAAFGGRSPGRVFRFAGQGTVRRSEPLRPSRGRVELKTLVRHPTGREADVSRRANSAYSSPCDDCERPGKGREP